MIKSISKSSSSLARMFRYILISNSVAFCSLSKSRVFMRSRS